MAATAADKQILALRAELYGVAPGQPVPVGRVGTLAAAAKARLKAALGQLGSKLTAPIREQIRKEVAEEARKTVTPIVTKGVGASVALGTLAAIFVTAAALRRRRR